MTSLLNELNEDRLSPPLDHALIAKKCEEWLIRLAEKMGEGRGEGSWLKNA